MKTIAIMQPYLFPYLGYFQLMKAVDQFIIYDDVNHIVRGWVNRNNIQVDGQKKLFSISLYGASSNKLINEIELADDFVKFKKMIATAYARAPFKDQIYDLVCHICAYNDKNLARFIANSLMEVANYLHIQTPQMFSSSLHKDNNLKAQAKIIAICKELEATNYINPIGGKELYSASVFKQENITLQFIEGALPEYKQFSNVFIPGLSIIDVMMFNSPIEINSMLNDYELV